ALRVGGHLLLQPRDAGAVLAADLPVAGLQLAGEQLEQGRLAGAVAADAGHALAGIDGKRDVFEQQRTADAVVDVLEGDQGHGVIVRGYGGRQARLTSCRTASSTPPWCVPTPGVSRRRRPAPAARRTAAASPPAARARRTGRPAWPGRSPAWRGSCAARR